MSAYGTNRPSAFAPLCPQPAEADIRLLEGKSRFDPKPTNSNHRDCSPIVAEKPQGQNLQSALLKEAIIKLDRLPCGRHSWHGGRTERRLQHHGCKHSNRATAPRAKQDASALSGIPLSSSFNMNGLLGGFYGGCECRRGPNRPLRRRARLGRASLSLHSRSALPR